MGSKIFFKYYNIDLYTGKRCQSTHINSRDWTINSSVAEENWRAKRLHWTMTVPKDKVTFHISLWAKKKRLILSLQILLFPIVVRTRKWTGRPARTWQVHLQLARGMEAAAQPGHKALCWPRGVPLSHAHHKLKRPVRLDQHFFLSTVACWCCKEV